MMDGFSGATRGWERMSGSRLGITHEQHNILLIGRKGSDRLYTMSNFVFEGLHTPVLL